MKGCGFCEKAKQLLKDLIKSGAVQVKDAKDAPKGVKGFPFLLNTENGQSHTGYPGTVENLMKKLGKSSSPSVTPKPTPFPTGLGCKTNDDCPNGSLCDISKNPPQCVKIPVPSKPTKLISCDPQLPMNNFGCPTGQTCMSLDPSTPDKGLCVTNFPPNGFGCNSDKDCPQGKKCNKNTRQCETSLTSGDIAGIVIGSIAGLILLVLLGMMIFKKGKKGSKSRK